MKKLLLLVATALLVLGIAGPTLAADESLPRTGRLLFVSGGDVDIATGEQADAVIVLGGHATVAGTVNALVVVDGTAAVDGATLESITVVNGRVDLSDTTTILGDINQLRSTVTGLDGATVGGTMRDLIGDVAAFGLFIGAAAIVLWVGVGLATLLFGLLLAGTAARQVRAATGLISREPLTVGLVGLLSLILMPVVAVLAMATLIGIPTGIGLLVLVWPTVAFVGYVVAAIWLGEWLLGRGRDPEAPFAARPYAAAALGLVVAFVIGLVPVVTAILSIVGIGAVVLAGWRTVRQRGEPVAAIHRPSPSPVG